MTQNILSASVSDRGLSEKRPQNEDSFLELPAYGLFVVADGVGGAQAGEVASQMATEVLSEAFANLRGGDVEDLMRRAIEQANGSIYQMSHDLPQLSTMATTIVALHIAGNIATIGHVGDSRLYRVDPRGNLFRETQDHSVVEEEVRAGRMTPAQAAHHPSKNVISRALGAETTVEVDMKTIMFEPNTSFLLCSDGVTRHIEDHELRQLLRKDVTPAEICSEIKNLCYQRGAEDNLTAVIVRAVGEAAAASQEEDDDENTVATARPAVVSNAAFAHPVEDSSEIPTQGLEMPAISAGSFQPLGASDEIQNENQVVIPAASSIGDTVEPAAPAINNYQPAREAKIFAAEETKAGSGFGKLIGGLVLGLLLGSIIGAAAYHLMSGSQTPTVVQSPPKITEMQSPNIPFSAFENNRRNVDGDPVKYISTNGTSADGAEDYYLLGRAYLLTEKYVDAKNAFTKAKELLPQSNITDKTMLGNEIAIGLSIVDSSFSKDVLKAERKNVGAATSQTSNTNTAANANTATNTAANSNTEIKPINTQTNANN